MADSIESRITVRTTMRTMLVVGFFGWVLAEAAVVSGAFIPQGHHSFAHRREQTISSVTVTSQTCQKARRRQGGAWFMSTTPAAAVGQPTELPDSLDDSSTIAAQSCAAFLSSTSGMDISTLTSLKITANTTQLDGTNARARVDFDTTAGDETYTLLKATTEFMQAFTEKLSYALVPGMMEWEQDRRMRVASARVELQGLLTTDAAMVEEKEKEVAEGEEENLQEESKEEVEDAKKKRITELKEILNNGGTTTPWQGRTLRVYFPDEGSAALAQRDWKLNQPDALVPPCVRFSSLGGVGGRRSVSFSDETSTSDCVVVFYCPKASEAQYAEQVLEMMEGSDRIWMSIFVNPNLVDMGVTGYGTAGRMLRERLIDGLMQTYYLRTLAWGALTRAWPGEFTVWQEDAEAEGGYKCIQSMDRLPSNPEVEDIYDIANGLRAEEKQGLGLLNALGDFVNGMTKL